MSSEILIVSAPDCDVETLELLREEFKLALKDPDYVIITNFDIVTQFVKVPTDVANENPSGYHELVIISADNATELQFAKFKKDFDQAIANNDKFLITPLNVHVQVL